MPARFLAVKLADLGDTLTVTAALQMLRGSHPGVEIDALVTPVGARALAGSPAVDRIITLEKRRFDRSTGLLDLRALAAAINCGWQLRRHRYDRLFLFHHLFTFSGRLKYAALLKTIGASWSGGVAEGSIPFLSESVRDEGYGQRHEAEYWCAVAALAGSGQRVATLDIALTGDDVAAGRALLRGEGPWIAFHPGSGGYSRARRWPAERFAAVADVLARSTGARIVLVGGDDERTLAAIVAARMTEPALNLAGQTSLKVLAAVLGECRLLVGNDSGVMHLATAVGTPVVAVFGPTNHVSWGPYGPAGQHRVVRADLPCAPCLYRGFMPGTPAGCASRDCLRLVEVGDVVEAALSVLRTRR